MYILETRIKGYFRDIKFEIKIVTFFGFTCQLWVIQIVVSKKIQFETFIL